MRLLSIILTLAVSISAAAQSYFDDKEFKKPIPHKSVYDNDKWTLKAVERSNELTILVLNYHEPSLWVGSSTKLDVDDCLINTATGERYPLLMSFGIPKSPAKYIWKEGADLNVEVKMLFPAIPESVKTLGSTFGLYDIDIKAVPVNTIPESTTVYPKDLTNKSGNLQIYNIIRHGDYVDMTFFYTCNSYGCRPSLSRDSFLRIPGSKDVFPLKSYMGITLSPEITPIGNSEKMAFMLSFNVPSNVPLNSFDFIETPTSTWNISNISLK